MFCLSNPYIIIRKQTQVFQMNNDEHPSASEMHTSAAFLMFKYKAVKNFLRNSR